MQLFLKVLHVLLADGFVCRLVDLHGPQEALDFLDRAELVFEDRGIPIGIHGTSCFACHSLECPFHPTVRLGLTEILSWYAFPHQGTRYILIELAIGGWCLILSFGCCR